MTRSARPVVTFFAHPDDAEILMGGTLLRLTDAGVAVHCVVASLPSEPSVRRAESMAAAEFGGFTWQCLDRDGTWQAEEIASHVLVAEFDKVMDQHQPGTVFTHALIDAHADHRHVAAAALASCRDRRVNLYLTEVANQYAPSYAPAELTTFVDVSAHFERRMALVNCHESQMRRRDYRDHLYARAQFRGDVSGYELAEAFTTVRTVLEIGDVAPA